VLDGCRGRTLLGGAGPWLTSVEMVLIVFFMMVPMAHSGSPVAHAAHRVSVNDVPAVIPAQGVWLGRHLALVRPAPEHVPRVVSRQRAIDASLVGSGSTRATLAVVSAPRRILAPHGPMRDRLTWVVVETLPRPLELRIGGPCQPGERPGRPYLVQHRLSLVDARSGEFLLGFFTP
jgi:hypothetical protein